MRATAGQLFVVIAFGISSHATKQAMGPAQVALERAGFSPVSFALVAASPLIGSILLPAVWGLFHKRFEAMAFAAVPSGELLGQALVALGLGAAPFLSGLGGSGFGESSAPPRTWEAAVVGGLALFSVFHGGIAVVQHTALAQILPGSLTTGFVIIVASTHVTTAICNIVAPRILEQGGLAALQLALLGPSVVLSVPAGVLLAYWTWCRVGSASDAGSKKGLVIPIWRQGQADALRTALLETSPCPCGREGPATCACHIDATEEPRALGAVLSVTLIATWRALLLGLGHALQSVLNGILVSLGHSPEAAGARLAASQLAALVALPIAALVADARGPRRLLFATSAAALLGGLALLWAAQLPSICVDIALFAWSLSQVVAPVLSLALVPPNATRGAHGAQEGAALGCSFGFGVLESVTSLAQVLFMVVIGVLREAGGFHLVLLMLCGGLGVACALAAALAPMLRDGDAAPAWVR